MLPKGDPQAGNQKLSQIRTAHGTTALEEKLRWLGYTCVCGPAIGNSASLLCSVLLTDVILVLNDISIIYAGAESTSDFLCFLSGNIHKCSIIITITSLLCAWFLHRSKEVQQEDRIHYGTAKMFHYMMGFENILHVIKAIL